MSNTVLLGPAQYLAFIQIAKHIPKYQRVVMLFNAGYRGARLQKAVAGLQ